MRSEAEERMINDFMLVQHLSLSVAFSGGIHLSYF